jgi:hypothetical protein
MAVAASDVSRETSLAAAVFWKAADRHDTRKRRQQVCLNSQRKVKDFILGRRTDAVRGAGEFG